MARPAGSVAAGYSEKLGNSTDTVVEEKVIMAL